MDRKAVAGVAGLPRASNINGCDRFSTPENPVPAQLNPEVCRTFWADFRAIGGAAALLLACAAPAAAGEISPAGTTIEIENTRCEVKSPYSILCQNIGRVCEAYRTRKEAEDKKTLGCGLKESPNYPCPPWKEMTAEIERDVRQFGHCTPMTFGGWW